MTNEQKIRRLEAKIDFLVYWGSLFHSIADHSYDQEKSKSLMIAAMEKHLNEIGLKYPVKGTDK